MSAGTVLIALLMLGCGIIGGYYIARNQQQHAPTTAEAERETSSGWAEAATERMRQVNRWQDILLTFHDEEANAGTVAEMTSLMANAIHTEFVDAEVLIAVGPINDILLIQTMATLNQQPIELSGNASIAVMPAHDRDSMHEMALEVHELLKKTRTTKRWILLRDLGPQLQTRLGRHYQFPGQAMVCPLFFRDTLCGFLLISRGEMGKNTAVTQDFGRFAALAGDIIINWVRSMAPQVLAGTTDPIDALPMQTMASLSLLERTAEVVQESAAAREMLDELAEYARTINTEAAEIALLAKQTCQSLRQICNADFALFFRADNPAEPNTFAVEAMETSTWSWTAFQGYLGSDEHPTWDEKTLARWPDRFIQEVTKQKRPVAASSAEEVRAQATIVGHLMDVGSFLAIPGLMRGRCEVIVVVGRQQPGGITESATLVASAAVSLASLGLTTMHLMHHEHNLQQSLDNAWGLASSVTQQSMTTLAGIVQRHSVLSVTNPQRVADYAEAIAVQLRLPAVEISYLRIAALVCDLGMIMIPSHILRKEGGLTPEEQQLVQNHPLITAALLDKLEVTKRALPIIIHHHERFDGKGYPKQVAHEAIPLGARILAVADTFVNMQIERPYRPAMTREAVLALMQQEVGKQFDPEVVQALLKVAAQETRAHQAA
jgi:HD-GYP domain-containing protein (c-di-GMP phosphodiesterase class II)